MDKSQLYHVDADVVVVGSGSAGQMASLSARWAGADVALVDKAGIYRSGCGAAGEDHFTAVLEEHDWDTPRTFLQHSYRTTGGLCDMKTVENGFIKHIKWLTNWLEELGVPMRLDRENNAYIRTAPFDMPGPFQINFDGASLMPKVAAEMKKAGVRFYPRTAVTDLLVKDGQVVGVVGLEFRTRNLFVFHSKAVVLCTGNVGRLYDNQSGEPYNLWNCPYNTGLGHRLAFEAGAEISNMEFIGFTVAPKNFGSPSMAAFTGMGAHIINGAGERIMFKYHPKGEAAPRWLHCWAVYKENLEGRGPIYMDVRHLSDKDLSHLVNNLLPVDKKSFGDYLEQKGINLRTDPLEVEVTGGEIAAGGVQPTGMSVDENFASTLPGLFGAGGCTTVPSGLPGAMCAGMGAGKSAARYAQGLNSIPKTADSALAAIQSRVYSPLDRKGETITSRQFEDKLRQIMTRYVRIGRTKAGLETALAELDWLGSYLPRLKASDGHELMRCQEAYDLLTVAKLIARGALIREESRFGVAHYRGDFPETREEWHKSIIQTKKGDGVEISFQPPFPSPE